MHRHDPHARLIRLATAYDADDGGDDGAITFTLPEDYATLPDEQLAALREEAVEAFEALHSVDEPSTEDVTAMTQLADAVDAIRAEETTRQEARQSNRSTAEELAARVNPPAEDPDEGGEGDGQTTAQDGAPAADADGGQADATEGEPTSVAAGASPAGVSVTVQGISRRQKRRKAGDGQPGRMTLVASADLGGYGAGDDVTIEGVADRLLRKTQGMTDSTYKTAYGNGRRVQHSIGLLSVVKPFPEELQATQDNGHEVLARVVDETRLPGRSLVAAGGWCAPSETDYALTPDLESTDGLVSVPEFGVVRGGLRWTRGPDFASLFAMTAFAFTEAQDVEGQYDAGAVGDKPCLRVECPDFSEARLSVDGICITAGILQNRAYPEVTARTIRGALVAHQHRMAAKTINAIAADSTAVAMPAAQIGALAPLLTAIELQISHARNVHRMADSASLEAIFPRWVRGVIRSDLSRRLGVDLLTVSNQQIQGWFAERGANAQFVYNYQDITGASSAFTAWPAEVRFLLYPAGTWARGSSDVISLDAIFDSALLAQNDFTALFTEEGWLMARRGHDSREVTVPICADGATHGGVDIGCDGALAAAPV